MKRRMLARCWGLVFCAGALALVPARVAMAIDEEVLLTTAEQACLAGNYQRGVEILANLYLATRKAAYLHNQARCYEQNGQNEAAIGRYNEFLRQATTLPVEKKAELEANIIRLEQKIARQRLQQQPQQYPQQPPQPQTQQPSYGAQPAQPPSAPAQPPYQPRYQPPAPTAPTTATPAPAVAAHAGGGGSKGLRIAGLATAAAGGVALIIGTASGLSAADTEKKLNDDVKNSRAYDPKRYDSGKTSASLATVGLIAGPILIGTGALLYFLGRPSGNETASVTPGLAFMPGGGLGLNLSVVH